MNQVSKQVQARKLKATLRMLQHAQRVSGNVSQTCRFAGVSRALFYIWKKRYEKNGLAGLGTNRGDRTTSGIAVGRARPPAALERRCALPGT
jgi:hypothetical protein